MSYVTIKPSGLLEGTNAGQIRQNASDFIANGAETILLDFQDVTFMNSSAIGALVATLKLVREAKRELYLCSLNPQLALIFELTKLDQVFQIFGDRTEFEQNYAVAASSS